MTNLPDAALRHHVSGAVERGEATPIVAIPVEPEHVDYPHEPGRLYDCPACEARCYCTPDTAECVWIGHEPNEPDTYLSGTGEIADDDGYVDYLNR